MTNAHHLYIHVPFCQAKCNYCAFFSRACRTPDWDAYADGICAEIRTWRGRLGPISVPTVFFGGGTPSLMPVGIFDRIMTAIRAAFDIPPDTEVTLESNPGTLDAARLNDFITAGVNRLSIGVQSFNDDELRFLGRIHTADAARQLIDAAHNAGIRVSGDFIYGLPGHNGQTVENLCREINQMGLTHCSLYELTIEPNTPFGKMNLTMPDNDTMADMYTAIGHTLQIPRYEVSNYAPPGNECRHNAGVWAGMPYIGLGTGAAGRPYINGVWHDQTGGPDGQCVPMDNATRAVEKIITGMRTIRGVDLTDDVRAALNMNAVPHMTDDVRITPDNRMVATERGLLILDNLLINLIA